MPPSKKLLLSILPLAGALVNCCLYYLRCQLASLYLSQDQLNPLSTEAVVYLIPELLIPLAPHSLSLIRSVISPLHPSLHLFSFHFDLCAS